MSPVKRRGPAGVYARWYCDRYCRRNPTPGHYPCRLCCGFTTDTAKHIQGSPAAATKN